MMNNFAMCFKQEFLGKKMFYFQLLIFIGVKHSMFLFSNSNDQIHFKQVSYREKKVRLTMRDKISNKMPKVKSLC